MRIFWGCCLVLVLLLWSSTAQAGPLADRLAQFPHWQGKPPVTAADFDLVYPDWMEGTWEVTSTLVDQVAPLAPDVVTPGFESNRHYLNQPVSFQVRFVEERPILKFGFRILDYWSSRQFPRIQNSHKPSPIQNRVVADRVFNGLNIARAYLGDRTVQSVKVDPSSPNRQITLLRGDRQLVSVVTNRGTERSAPDRFIATEVSQQIFRGTPQLYFNTVETTTAYYKLQSSSPVIEADQVTAVYRESSSQSP